MIKSLVLKFGEILINVVVALGIIVSVIMLFANPIGGIGMFLGVVVASFTIFLLMDIRDKISKNNELLEKNN